MSTGLPIRELAFSLLFSSHWLAHVISPSSSRGKRPRPNRPVGSYEANQLQLGIKLAYILLPPVGRGKQAQTSGWLTTPRSSSPPGLACAAQRVQPDGAYVLGGPDARLAMCSSLPVPLGWPRDTASPAERGKPSDTGWSLSGHSSPYGLAFSRHVSSPWRTARFPGLRARLAEAFIIPTYGLAPNFDYSSLAGHTGVYEG